MRYLMIASMLFVAAAAPAGASDVGDSFERHPTAHEIIRMAGASYLNRSLDKTIVVRRDQAYTVPATAGPGHTLHIPAAREAAPQAIG